MKSFRGCWTCRIRHKKCDEKHPTCDACSALHITCYFDNEKPDWMDGGVRQGKMADQLKREVKQKAQRRREERAAWNPSEPITQSETTSGQTMNLAVGHSIPTSHRSTTVPDSPRTGRSDFTAFPTTITAIGSQPETDKLLDTQTSRSSGFQDACLLTFYLENFLPFLFPFYRPSPLQGGRSWILDMMMTSPVVRKTALCQSTYFFSLALGTVDCDVAWDRVFIETREAFETLRQSLQSLDERGVSEHLHEAVRTLAGIMQLQRFDIAASSFENCQAHLSAALALLKQILDTSSKMGSPSNFNDILARLGPSSWVLPSQCVQVPSAESSALRFSTSLLIIDDIVSSTVRRTQPSLYEYHQRLLSNTQTSGPPIDLEAITGCQNWVVLQLGEICALDAWKTECKRAGILDVMVLVQKATIIRNSLVCQLTQLKADVMMNPAQHSGVLDMFALNYSQPKSATGSQSRLVTRVWAHTALLHLWVIVSGWQPANPEVRSHVDQILELLTHEMSPPALLRTMTWPFCIAGCLAEPVQETSFRDLVEVLQPPNIFGTLGKALKIMENVWQNRNAADIATRDLMTCLRGQGEPVLLV